MLRFGVRYYHVFRFRYFLYTLYTFMKFYLQFSSAFIHFHEMVSFTELGKFSLICFHIRLLIFWIGSQSLTLQPTELPEHCTGIFYFIRCGLSRNYSTTIEALPQIVVQRGFEPRHSELKSDILPLYYRTNTVKSLWSDSTNNILITSEVQLPIVLQRQI